MPIYNCSDCSHRSPWERGECDLLYADCLFQAPLPTCVETSRQKLVNMEREHYSIGMISKGRAIGYIHKCEAHPRRIADRETDRQKLLIDIEWYRGQPPLWDGQAQKEPNPECLDAAIAFVKLLPTHLTFPAISISGGEDVSLYWRDERKYLAVAFSKNKTLSWYYRTNQSANSSEERFGKESIYFDKCHIPASIMRYIARFL